MAKKATTKTPASTRATKATKVEEPKTTPAKNTHGKRAPKAKKPELRPVAFCDIETFRIDPSPFQPRTDFDANELFALSESIKRDGLLQPIIVRPEAGAALLGPHGEVNPDCDFELLDGERRLRACKMAGIAMIRAEVRECSDAQARSIVLVSSLQRADLNPIEQAMGMQAVLDAGDVKGVTALAKMLGMSQGAASNKLRLLELPKAWRQKIISREMTERHGREVLSIEDPEVEAQALEWIEHHSDTSVEKFRTAIEAIEEAIDAKKPSKGPAKPADAALLDAAMDLYDSDLELPPAELETIRSAIYDNRGEPWDAATRRKVQGLVDKYRSQVEGEAAGKTNLPARSAGSVPSADVADREETENLDDHIANLQWAKEQEKLAKVVEKLIEKYPTRRPALVQLLQALAKRHKK